MSLFRLEDRFRDLRRSPRFEIHYLGLIDLGRDATPVNCIICDISATGAKLTVGASEVPDEFMLVFRNLDMRSAADICERIRRAAESWDWQSIHPQLRVTLSMGLATSASFSEPQALLDTADHWLYEAKHHGRNQVQPVILVPA